MLFLSTTLIVEVKRKTCGIKHCDSNILKSFKIEFLEVFILILQIVSHLIGS